MIVFFRATLVLRKKLLGQ